MVSRRFPEVERDSLYARILCGEVLVGGERIRDPKACVSEDALVTFQNQRYVSRGGRKIEHALTRTDFPFRDRVVLDAGASTGGFTDCLLQHGARHVHAIDVGVNQLAYSLRIDPRVTVHENTNIMSVASLDPQPAVATADISFRSIRGVAARILDICTERIALVLVKPQFELQHTDEEFDGVLRDSGRILQVLLSVARGLRHENVYIEDVIASPISGRKGNQEFFFRLGRESLNEVSDFRESISREVDYSRGRDCLDKGSPM